MQEFLSINEYGVFFHVLLYPIILTLVTTMVPVGS
jgi:hypothetical protein